MRALLIMGPTASGKSALALALADRLGGEIVNADSMQVYQDLRVLTARPTVEEEARAPHHLYGHVDAAVRYSVGAWSRAARSVIGDIAARGKTPIVVGGTGLYFMALTQGLAEIPAPGAEARAEVAAADESALHDWLKEIDPEAAATIQTRDRPRIVRALEVMLSTGVSILDWRAGTKPILEPGAWTGVALTPPRDPLYAAIDARFGVMLAGGSLEEARALAARGLDPMLPCMKAHGMPWLAAHLRDEIDLETAALHGRQDTRRYAKRQFTWIRNRMPGWEIVEEVSPDRRIEQVLALQITD